MKTTFALKRYMRRGATALFNLNRPASYPYISGDGFRSIAQHIFDESSSMSPHEVEDGDIVFVNTDYLEDFFTSKHPHIQKRYILITHNSDICITHKHKHFAENQKIIHWFARNCLLYHPNVTPIPIGVMNAFLNHIGTTSDLVTVAHEIPSKALKISFGFSLISGSERLNLYRLLENHILGVHISEKKQRTYFEQMARYAFVASPEGNGPDCHRTWEALYLGCIPIVKESPFIEYFKHLGLPLYSVSDWKSIKEKDENDWMEIFQNLSHNGTHKALFMSYWIEEILKKREILFANKKKES